jgi:hypothetical protein
MGRQRCRRHGQGTHRRPHRRVNPGRAGSPTGEYELINILGHCVGIPEVAVGPHGQAGPNGGDAESGDDAAVRSDLKEAATVVVVEPEVAVRGGGDSATPDVCKIIDVESVIRRRDQALTGGVAANAEHVRIVIQSRIGREPPSEPCVGEDREGISQVQRIPVNQADVEGTAERGRRADVELIELVDTEFDAVLHSLVPCRCSLASQGRWDSESPSGNDTGIFCKNSDRSARCRRTILQTVLPVHRRPIVHQLPLDPVAAWPGSVI